jgi:hypothetical protein
MNDTKVVGYFSGKEASSDIKHVAKFSHGWDILGHVD